MTAGVLVLLTGMWEGVGAALREPPMAYHHTFGPAIDSVTRLGWGLGIISILVVLIVGALVLGGVFRKRTIHVETDLHDLAVQRDAGGMAWIYIGVGTTCVILAGCMVWTMIAIASVSRPPAVPTVTIQITASQWWWSLRYGSDDPAHIFTTANEIHVPVGQPVRVELVSGDVIHSFWIPQLAGKMDVIPGQTNVMWLQANRVGTYRGQCGAFCGPQHAHMAMFVVAQTPNDFSSWQENQLRDGAQPTTEEARSGEQIFQTHCASCHTVRGIAPSGIVGPDLTHLMSRNTLAAGLLLNTPGNLAGWIANPQSLKPGTRMPDPSLSGPELMAVTAYLHTLR